MPNPAVSQNLLSVLRFGALGGGIFFGLAMDRKYTAAHEAHVSHTKQHEEIVAKAHKIWDEHVAKEVGLTFEPDDPNFDLEKVMEYMSKSE